MNWEGGEGGRGGREERREGGGEGGRERREGGGEGEEVTLQQIVLLRSAQVKRLTYQTVLHPVLSNC